MRIQEMKQKPVEQLTGSEVIQSVVGAISAKPQQKPSSIILYLREGLNVAERNFTKYPNEIHDLIKSNLKEMSEGILYMYLWWISWGFGKNYCRVGYGKIVSKTLIGCIKTAQRAMESLVKKGFVIKGLTDKGKPDVNTKGALYRVLTPKEVLDGKTEEGVPLEDIPINGVVMKYSNKAYSNGDYGNNDHSGIDLKTMDSITMLGTKQDNIRISKDHSNKDHSNKDHPFKDRSKDSFKDSLSKDEIIDQYYNSIGQEKLSKAKRERAKKCFEELIQDGFTNDDIQFAVEWTIRNAKEKPYDFSEMVDHLTKIMQVQ